jgi:hypothetical protein
MIDFVYPTRTGKWNFNCPWNLYRWHHWFYRRWRVKTPNNSIWNGLIICGWKRIDISWDCEPEEALKQFKLGKNRLYKYLQELLDNNKATPDERDK